MSTVQQVYIDDIWYVKKIFCVYHEVLINPGNSNLLSDYAPPELIL